MRSSFSVSHKHILLFYQRGKVAVLLPRFGDHLGHILERIPTGAHLTEVAVGKQEYARNSNPTPYEV